jgi:integrase/recombinase XerC
MKNPETTALKPSWASALGDFEETMRRQGLAEKTRSAYRVDLAQLGEWAGAQHLDPEGLDFRQLRRFAGVLSERGMSRSTVARKLASIRTFYASLVRAGPTWSPAPSARPTCPPCSSRVS